MDGLIEWLRTRSYYEGQIRSYRRLETREPTLASVDLKPRLASALEGRDIDRLYRHQVEAAEVVRNGDNIVLATWAASGKNFAYTVPAFEWTMDRGGRVLYLGSQNALAADQLDMLSDLVHGLGFGSRVSVGQYTGRLSKSEKREVRRRIPTVLFSNPDVVHCVLLPHVHRLWEWFFSPLEMVAIDEVHGYRGVFGSCVTLLIHRLERVCGQSRADPQFVCCSTTVDNPIERAARIAGKREDPFMLVDEDIGGIGETSWPLWDPPEYENPGAGGSSRRCLGHVETKNLFIGLIAHDHQMLALTRARRAAERYASESASDLRSRGRHDLTGEVVAYQALLIHDWRRGIEADLHDGDTAGVWGTNALELGIDVGGLDAILIDGYPGVRMSAWQQAGWAGRGNRPALVALVDGEDQLDQYLMNHPAGFFDSDPERTVSDPENNHLLPSHVTCTAMEDWLSTEDESKFGASFPGIVSDLGADGTSVRRKAGDDLRQVHDGSESL